jgi:hypothetical protein
MKLCDRYDSRLRFQLKWFDVVCSRSAVKLRFACGRISPTTLQSRDPYRTLKPYNGRSHLKNTHEKRRTSNLLSHFMSPEIDSL